MKINKNSNTYIIIYIVVMVVAVGSALAYTSMSLRDRQQANMDNDKKRQILAALHISPAPDSVAAVYSATVVSEFIVNDNGERVEGNAFNVDVASQTKLADSQRLLPVYEATVNDNARKYVLPVYGTGLWGPIWGYVAVDADGSTIYGAYFDHQGETPGLGAEIAKPAFCDQFDGKQMMQDGKLVPIAVVKKGQKYTGGEYVDGVSGGTITSKGVSAMLSNCLQPYQMFLRSRNPELHRLDSLLRESEAEMSPLTLVKGSR